MTEVGSSPSALADIAADYCEHQGVGKSCYVCRRDIAGFVEAVKSAGFMLMRDLNTHPDPTCCSYCGSEFSNTKSWCSWCDGDTENAHYPTPEETER